ncbi:discoidin domain-containing protein [Actinosynnema sp. CA-248983]
MPRPRTLLTAVLAALVLATLLTATGAQGQVEVLLSQGKPTTASSEENAGAPAAAATDGDPGTRWSSAFSDPQWLQVDLGAPAVLSRVNLQWENAFATAFRIETSPDAATWTTVHTTTNGTGGTQNLTVSGTGRYVRLVGTTRATGWGYSLWEFRVYGTTAPDTGAPISQYKQVTASTWEGGNAPAAALDGRTTTRWSSQFADNQWLRVDFGGVATVREVLLVWESAYASAYRIELSTDGTAWTTAHSTTTGRGGTERLTVQGTGRYLRLFGVTRATGYGISLWELQVFGTVDTSATTPPLLSPPTKAPANPGRFALTAPVDNAMVTSTRRPAFSWAAVPGATRYQVWLNLSRTDYDFTASGNLIDLYTKVAEPTGTSYTPTWDIADRWTYKWFVVAVDGSGPHKRPRSARSACTCRGCRRSRTAPGSSTAAVTSTRTAPSRRMKTGGGRSKRGRRTCSGA